MRGRNVSPYTRHIMFPGPSMPASSPPDRSRYSLTGWHRTLLQIIALSGVWLLAHQAERLLHVPAGVIGILLLLVLLCCKVVNADWLRSGADWLLAEMMLFFIPAVVAIVNYPTLLRQSGWRIGIVIVVSTLLVMITVGTVVDLVFRWELRQSERRAGK
jgi:holin-like protein